MNPFLLFSKNSQNDKKISSDKDDETENQDPEEYLYLYNAFKIIGVLMAMGVVYQYAIYIRKALTTEITFKELFGLFRKYQVNAVEVGASKRRWSRRRASTAK